MFAYLAFMNYFELFQIPVCIRQDAAVLKTKFYQLSRQYHPDLNINASEEQQAEALEIASLLNKAYKTLQNEDETIRYILSLHQLIEEEEKYELAPDFLMEMMELNEELTEAKMEDEGKPEKLDQAEKKLHQLLTEIYKDVEEIIINYQEATVTEKELLRLKDYYYKKKYLKRISDRI